MPTVTLTGAPSPDAIVYDPDTKGTFHLNVPVTVTDANIAERLEPLEQFGYRFSFEETPAAPAAPAPAATAAAPIPQTTPVTPAAPLEA